MFDDITHGLEKFESTKSTWDRLLEQFRVILPTYLHAIYIKLSKLKCHGTMGIAKCMHVLNNLLSNLEANRHPYTEEQKCLIVVNTAQPP